LVIDEAQNLTPLEAKTIHHAALATGRKSFLRRTVSDRNRMSIRRPMASITTVSKFREQSIAAHIELQKGERSELAELAANLL